MTTAIPALAVLAAPCLAVAALLVLADRVRDRRLQRFARQISLTDAIHRELGAVAAPVLERRGRGWRVSMALPVERPDAVAAVLDVARRHFADIGAAGVPVEFLVTPRIRAAGPGRVSRMSPRRRAAGAPQAA